MFLQIAATVALSWAAVGQTVEVDTAISLQDAVRQKKVRVDVKSRGGAAGATVRVEVQRLVPETLKIKVESGTVLINAEKTEQNIAVGRLKGEFTRENMYRPGSVMVLADSKNHAFLLEVYCLDYAKKGVRKGGKLELALRDKRVARILNPPAGIKPTVGAVQIAIWMDRAGITAEQARKRYRGTTTEVDVQIARQLLVHAEKKGIESIPDDMPSSVKVHVSKLFSADPKIRSKAAAAIGQLGPEAEVAVSLLSENMLDRSTDKPLPLSVTRLDVDAALGTAADTLERLGIAELSPLIQSLRDGGSGAAMEVEGLVGELLNDGLIRQLSSPLALVRIRAARRLGNSGNQQAVSPLIDLLEDENQRVRDTAAAALKSLTQQDFGTDAALCKWLEDQ